MCFRSKEEREKRKEEKRILKEKIAAGKARMKMERLRDREWGKVLGKPAEEKADYMMKYFNNYLLECHHCGFCFHDHWEYLGREFVESEKYSGSEKCPCCGDGAVIRLVDGVSEDAQRNRVFLKYIKHDPQKNERYLRLKTKRDALYEEIRVECNRRLGYPYPENPVPSLSQAEFDRMINGTRKRNNGFLGTGLFGDRPSSGSSFSDGYFSAQFDAALRDIFKD